MEVSSWENHLFLWVSAPIPILRLQEQREALAEGQLLSTLKHPHGASVIHDLKHGDLTDTSMVDIWFVYG